MFPKPDTDILQDVLGESLLPKVSPAEKNITALLDQHKSKEAITLVEQMHRKDIQKLNILLRMRLIKVFDEALKNLESTVGDDLPGQEYYYQKGILDTYRGYLGAMPLSEQKNHDLDQLTAQVTPLTGKTRERMV